TEAGHVLLSGVQKGFAHFSRGLDDLEALKKSGTVRVNVTPRFALKWLAPRLSDFSHKFPAIKLKYHQSTEATDFSTSDADVSIEW
nr:hypothetical protein [Desulfuromonadales bacterium]